MKLDKSKNNIIKKFLGILLIIVIYIPLYLFLFEYIDCRSLMYFYLLFISVFILKIILYILYCRGICYYRDIDVSAYYPRKASGNPTKCSNNYSRSIAIAATNFFIRICTGKYSIGYYIAER